jgi:cytochrome P450
VLDLAAPLPLGIICDMMGIPESQNQFVFDQTNVILGLTDPEYVAPARIRSSPRSPRARRSPT